MFSIHFEEMLLFFTTSRRLTWRECHLLQLVISVYLILLHKKLLYLLILKTSCFTDIARDLTASWWIDDIQLRKRSFVHSICKILAQDCDRLIPMGRDLGRFLIHPAALKAGSAARSDQVAQVFIQLGFERLQGLRLHRLSGQSPLLPACPHEGQVSPYSQS